MLLPVNIWQNSVSDMTVPNKFAPGKRWGLFPAGSLGWRISEEDFFKESLPMLDDFKIRGSYGKVGDEGDFAAYQYLTGYTYPSGNYVLGIRRTFKRRLKIKECLIQT